MYCTVVAVACTGWIVTVKSAGVPGWTSPSTMVESPIEITGADVRERVGIGVGDLRRL